MAVHYGKIIITTKPHYAKKKAKRPDKQLDKRMSLPFHTIATKPVKRSNLTKDLLSSTF